MAKRSKPYTLNWPFSKSQLENIDKMFEQLYKLVGVDPGTTVLTSTTTVSAGNGRPGPPGRAGRDGDRGPLGPAGAPGASGTAADVESAGYWSPLTNGDVTTPELVFALGDTIAVWTPTP